RWQQQRSSFLVVCTGMAVPVGFPWVLATGTGMGTKISIQTNTHTCSHRYGFHHIEFKLQIKYCTTQPQALFLSSHTTHSKERLVSHYFMFKLIILGIKTNQKYMGQTE